MYKRKGCKDKRQEQEVENQLLLIDNSYKKRQKRKAIEIVEGTAM